MSSSRYVRKLPSTRLGDHVRPSVQRRIPASFSSQAKTEPDRIVTLSLEERRRCTRCSCPRRQASNIMSASWGVLICPK